MKIGVVVTRKDHMEVNVTPAQAIAALKQEIVRRINEELRSLNLPESELKIPLCGFQVFYVAGDGTLRAYHEEGRHPRNIETDIEVLWGVEGFKKLVEFHDQLHTMYASGVFNKP